MALEYFSVQTSNFSHFSQGQGDQISIFFCEGRTHYILAFIFNQQPQYYLPIY